VTETHTKISVQMRTALTAYTGPITKCPAGKPRGKVVKLRDAADRWLNKHRASSLMIKDEKAERRKVRLARAQRERIANRNAAIRKRIGEVKKMMRSAR
jgi:hypothetical protein